mmetsp:Transcript_67542/g.187196  ORF Transcript_67542/g.187196 Transcript_67542/m.187196 type:complete len:170 (+) Transcript_67542:1819-2328(+)
MTRFLGSGLLKRIKTPEWNLPVGPVVGRVAEDIEQLLAGLAVEAHVVGQLFQHDDKARLAAGLVDEVGHAVMQCVQVLAKVSRKQEGLSDAIEHVLLGLRLRQVGVQEMLARLLGGLHQVLDPVGPYGLHDVGTDGLQKHGLDPPFKSQNCGNPEAHRAASARMRLKLA